MARDKSFTNLLALVCIAGEDPDGRYILTHGLDIWVGYRKCATVLHCQILMAWKANGSLAWCKEEACQMEHHFGMDPRQTQTIPTLRQALPESTKSHRVEFST